MGPGSDDFQVVPLAYGGNRDPVLLLKIGQDLLCDSCCGKRVPLGEMPRVLQKW